MSEEGNSSFVPMETMMLGDHANGSYSPPSDGEGVGQPLTSDEEL